MVVEVKRYKAKHGDVIVECYHEGTGTVYHVRYNHPYVGMNGFFESKRDAIVHAQFLASKY